MSEATTVKRTASQKKRDKELAAEQKKAKLEEKKAKQAALASATAANQKQKEKKKPAAVDAYDPSRIEEGRYEWWEKQGLFKPQFTPDGKVKPAGKFVIPIPPPNVTGSLHMGHALTNALQDTMIRHARMCGKTTAWIPGCDHAGISTQSVVEKMLWKTEKKTRHDLGREKLVSIIWDWKDKYHKNITAQLKSLGGSMDWSREAFTMDDNLSRAVRHTFIQLHDEGIIYRANRLVNWCTALATSLSNAEVENEDIEKRTLLDVPGYERKVEFGVLTYFKYPLEDGKETIEVATTRPETMLGDTGIAVHPTDPRYQHLIGKFVQHPFLPDRKLLIFADDTVEKDFGTGAVKITPAHDFNDFTRGQKAGLAFINIFTDDGKLNENAGSFAGMKRFDARYEVVTQLKAKGLYVKSEDNKMVIPRCAKSKDVIEPILKPQWWMKMDSLVKPAVDAVKDGRIKIQPEVQEKKYFIWMNNMQDWCLSRQLWWGHRAPAYFIQLDGETGDDADGNLWVCAENIEAATEKAQKKFPGKKFTLKWDEDVLDTWFSSGLWPFSTLGWPGKTIDMDTLYPTSMLETGWDILFFWVIRMVMLGLKMTGEVPFTEVYCHGLIRDSEGRKMSKSLGNVIDPLDIIHGITLKDLHDKLKFGNLDPKEVKRAEDYQKKAFPKGIPPCGADALRFALVNYTTSSGGDIAFKIEVLEAERRFCNKIYQAITFVLKRLGEDFKPAATANDNKPVTLAEKWILSRFNAASAKINADIEAREFYQVAQTLRTFWHNELCDIFIENTKWILDDEASPEAEKQSAKQTLYTAAEGALRLLHPVMPYITEHLWQKMPRRPDDPESIMIAAYPQGDMEPYEAEAASYEKVMNLAEEARSFLAELKEKDGGKLLVKSDGEAELGRENLTSFNSLIAALKCGRGTVAAEGPHKSDVLMASKEVPGVATLYFVSEKKN